MAYKPLNKANKWQFSIFRERQGHSKSCDAKGFTSLKTAPIPKVYHQTINTVFDKVKKTFSHRKNSQNNV